MRLFSILALVLILTPVVSLAERFDVRLGGRVIGTLDSSANVLTTVLDNTPLGLADGQFTARLSRSGGALRYESESDKRRISFTTQAGRVTEVEIAPADERTALSDPSAVSAVVQDPVSVISRLISADGCPAPFRMYDGRRVVEAAVTNDARTATTLVCDMVYRVTAGPGHLSPFRFGRVELRLTYDLSNAQRLALLQASAGGMTLELAR